MAAFEPPSAAERERAIGSTNGLPVSLCRAFRPTGFAPMTKPGPNDWLAMHRESGQTFEQFTRANPNRPDTQRNKIYLLPLGSFPEKRSPPLITLRDYAAAFFGMEVEVLPAVPIDFKSTTTRTNQYTQKRQLLTSDILTGLQQKLPKDAFCLLGITMEDLYPDPTWNFVFGQASLQERVGVYSFVRYDPSFYGQPPGTNDEKLILRRSCDVLTHETGHMFGMPHCIYFNCLMAGSNHLQESDARPMHLCPVCLRKLHFSVELDITERYRRLKACCNKMGFKDESAWITDRLKQITAP